MKQFSFSFGLRFSVFRVSRSAWEPSSGPTATLCTFWHDLSSDFVFQMCELEVATSLVKAMTNGAARRSVGRGGRNTLYCSTGVHICRACPPTPLILACNVFLPRRWGKPMDSAPRACLHVSVRVWICWTSRKFDTQVWKLGVRFMCDKWPTRGIIQATRPLLLSSVEETHSSHNFEGIWRRTIYYLCYFRRSPTSSAYCL